MLMFSVALLGCGLCACRSDTAEHVLVMGSTISTSQGAGGLTEIVVSIPEGNPGAGTWAAKAHPGAALLDIAGAAKASLGEQGTVVSVDVTRSGELIGFTINHSAAAP